MYIPHNQTGWSAMKEIQMITIYLNVNHCINLNLFLSHYKNKLKGIENL